jgi:hypothetical protein
MSSRRILVIGAAGETGRMARGMQARELPETVAEVRAMLSPSGAHPREVGLKVLPWNRRRFLPRGGQSEIGHC